MEFYTYCACVHTCTWYVCATMLVCGGERTILWSWCSFFCPLNGIHVNSGLTHLTILWTQKMDAMGNWNRAELPGASGAWVTSTWALHWPWVPSSGSKSEPAHTRTAFILSTKGSSPTVHRALSRIQLQRGIYCSTMWFLVPCMVQCWALWAMLLLCFSKSHRRCAHRWCLHSLFV